MTNTRSQKPKGVTAETDDVPTELESPKIQDAPKPSESYINPETIVKLRSQVQTYRVTLAEERDDHDNVVRSLKKDVNSYRNDVERLQEYIKAQDEDWKDRMKQRILTCTNDFKNKISLLQGDLRLAQQARDDSDKKYLAEAGLSAKYIAERDGMKVQVKLYTEKVAEQKKRITALTKQAKEFKKELDRTSPERLGREIELAQISLQKARVDLCKINSSAIKKKEVIQEQHKVRIFQMEKNLELKEKAVKTLASAKKEEREDRLQTEVERTIALHDAAQGHTVKMSKRKKEEDPRKKMAKKIKKKKNGQFPAMDDSSSSDDCVSIVTHLSFFILVNSHG